MGFSWSPFLAQAVSMRIVLKTIESVGFDISAYTHLPTPPAYVAIRDTAGRIQVLSFVWYDNVFIACIDPTKATKTLQQLPNLV